jgi:hypothetical protein
MVHDIEPIFRPLVGRDLPTRHARGRRSRRSPSLSSLPLRPFHIGIGRGRRRPLHIPHDPQARGCHGAGKGAGFPPEPAAGACRLEPTLPAVGAVQARPAHGDLLDGAPISSRALAIAVPVIRRATCSARRRETKPSRAAKRRDGAPFPSTPPRPRPSLGMPISMPICARAGMVSHGVAAGPMAPVADNLASVPDSDVAVYVASLMGSAQERREQARDSPQ